MDTQVSTEKSRIVVNPDIRFGRPTIRGTRITVENVLRLAAMGLSSAEIIQEYPGLEDADIFAAQKYAADHLRDAFASRQAAE